MTVEGYLQSLDQPWRRVDPEAWGVTFADVGGWPLDVGLAVRGPSPRLLALQAPVGSAALADPAALLHRNRRLRLVRFTSTRGGEVWLQGELPWPVDVAMLELAFVVLVGAAADVRYAAVSEGG